MRRSCCRCARARYFAPCAIWIWASRPTTTRAQTASARPKNRRRREEKAITAAVLRPPESPRIGPVRDGAVEGSFARRRLPLARARKPPGIQRADAGSARSIAPRLWTAPPGYIPLVRFRCEAPRRSPARSRWAARSEGRSPAPARDAGRVLASSGGSRCAWIGRSGGSSWTSYRFSVFSLHFWLTFEALRDAQSSASRAGIGADFFLRGSDRAASQDLQELPRATDAPGQARGTEADAGIPPESFLDHPVFQRVVGDNGDPAAGIQVAYRGREEMRQREKLLIDLDAQGLEHARGRIDLAASASLGAGHDPRQLPGRIDRAPGAFCDDSPHELCRHP